MISKYKYIIVLITIIILSASCASEKNQGKLLIGEWQPITSQVHVWGTLEFLTDGTLIREKTITWKYRLLDSNRLVVDAGMGGLEFLFEFSVTKDELKLKYKEEGTTTYSRIKKK